MTTIITKRKSIMPTPPKTNDPLPPSPFLVTSQRVTCVCVQSSVCVCAHLVVMSGQ